MCGIAGSVGLERLLGGDRPAVERMTSSLECRGPDDYRVRSEDEATFGHTRLAVVDPECAIQPFVVRQGGSAVMIAFGGEIYNFIELRQTLKGLGHAFGTASDTEVVARGFVEWGLEFFLQCRGMFAIAIWDGRAKVLHLVRDPLGIKPLFFCARKNLVIFGSEPKSLFAHGEVEPTVNKLGLVELLGLWPYKTPGSEIYEGVSEVKPGETVTWNKGVVKRRMYWKLSDEINTEDSFDDAVRNVSALLDDAVRLQLRADVPVSFAISGGVDSSSIAGIAQRHADRRLRTYSVGFVDPQATFARSVFRPELDEAYIAIAVENLGSRHTHIALSESDICSALDRATLARDLPDTGDMDASLLLLFEKIARDSYRVALVGEGADELFGGYPWFREAEERHATFPWRRYLCIWPEFIRRDVRHELRLEEYVSDQFQHALRSVPVMPTEAPELRGLREMSYLDLTRFLPGQLERMDRASMANGVEARVPFCDHTLVQYVWQLPMQYKQASPREKHLLREALVGTVSEKIRTRAKASYPTLGGGGHESFLRSAVQRVLEDQEWGLADVLDTVAIQEALTGTTRVPTRASVWLGRIFSLYRWVKAYNPSFRA